MFEAQELTPITESDDRKTGLEKINHLMSQVKDIRNTVATRHEIQQLTERFSSELRAHREAAVRAHRAPTGLESTIAERYGSRSKSGAPTLRLYDQDVMGERVPGLLTDTVTCGAWHERAKRHAQNASIVALVRSGARDDLTDPRTVKRLAPKSIKRLNYWLRQGPDDLVKRVFTDTAGVGGEFIPDVTIPDIVVHAGLLSAQLASGLLRQDPMSSSTVTNPFAGAGLTPYLMGKATADDPAQYSASTMDTDERQRTAIKWGVRSVVDADADEDSIVDSQRILIEQIGRAIALGRDDLLFNGDSTASHGDTGIANWNPRSVWSSGKLGSSVDHRRAYIGLRHRALDIGSGATKDLSTMSSANILELRAKLEPPHGGGDLVMFVPEEVLIKHILDLDEVATVDKYGSAASVLTGEVARLFGMRVVPAYMLTKDLNASGVYDHSTTTKGQMVIANIARWRWGVRRGLQVETDKDITRGVHNIVASRRDVLWSPDSTTTRNVAYGYNIA